MGYGYQAGSLRIHNEWKYFTNEKDFYRQLSLPWVPPELRELQYRNPADLTDEVKNLISLADIRADLHIHSNWSDGKNTIEEMAVAALKKGIKTIAITDHSPHLLRSRYADASYFLKQQQEIHCIRNAFAQQLTILAGAEVDILPDGSLDLPEEILAVLDLVVASLHVELDQPREVITARLIQAIENPYVHIIGHPGGRLYPVLDIADLDWERVYRAAANNQVALEINSHKSHPLFDSSKVRRASALGVPIALNSDAHTIEMLETDQFGLFIARRAGLKTDQVINTWPSNYLKSWLEKKRKPSAVQQ